MSDAVMPRARRQSPRPLAPSSPLDGKASVVAVLACPTEPERPTFKLRAFLRFGGKEYSPGDALPEVPQELADRLLRCGAVEKG